MATAMGLRERKKLRTEEDVTRVALELFARRGYEAVTIDEIAEAAMVSPRTVYRYFAAKEELVLGDNGPSLEQFREEIARRPADEPILESVRTVMAMLAERRTADHEMNRRRAAIIDVTPSLRLRLVARRSEFQAGIAALLAEHLEHEPLLRRELIASCTAAAVSAAIYVWIATGAEGDVEAVIDDALDQLGRGLGTAR